MKETKENQSTQSLSRTSLDIVLANMFSNAKYNTTYVFYGYMISMCSIVLEKMEAPAAISFHLDHYKLHINPELFDQFTLEQQLFILQHEMHHILNGHVFRKEDRDHQAFNYATDCAINQLGDTNHMPQGLIVPANFPSKKKVPDNLSAEQYYELIDKDQLPPEDPQSSTGQGGGHDKWDESEGDEDLQKDITKNMIEKAIEQTQATGIGSLPSNISDYLNLFSRKAQLDWKKVLRKITGNKKVNSRKTIMRRDRRNPSFEHIKGKTKDRMFDLLVIGDESGSVNNQELSEAIGEIIHICDVTKASLDYIAIDTDAHAPIKLKRSQRSFTRQACGGTNLNPALDMATKHGIKWNAAVIITDGDLTSSDVAVFEQTNKQIIWLITSDGQAMPEMDQGRMRSFKLDKKE